MHKIFLKNRDNTSIFGFSTVPLSWRLMEEESRLLNLSAFLLLSIFKFVQLTLAVLRRRRGEAFCLI